MANPFETKPVHVKWQRDWVTTWTAYHHDGQVFDVFTTAKFNTMAEMIYEGAKRNPDKDFLVDEQGNRMTFKEVVAAAENVAEALLLSDPQLKDQQLRKGDRVGVIGRNSMDWIISFLAVSIAGLVVVPMNSWWTPREMEYAIRLANCKLIFADAQRIERFNKIANRNELRCKIVQMESPRNNTSDGNTIFDYLENGRKLANRKVRTLPTAHPDEPMMIMFTSGTTNFPKGVVLTNRGFCHTMNTYDKVFMITAAMVPPNTVLPPTAILLSVPLFHATGLYAILLASLLFGRKVVIMQKWNAEKALGLIQREKVTHFTGVPTMVLDMINHPRLHEFDISSLKNVGSGGAPPPQGVAKTIQTKLKASPGQGFGLTEVNCVATLISAQDYLERPGSCGKPIPGVSIQIWPEDKDDVEVPRGQAGRIAIRGPTLMLEYLNDLEATRKAITNTGWFVTGDYGHMDEDGFLYISGRSQDLIIRGGENISARTVEEAVFQCFDSVQECAVFGYPHALLGEEVGVAIRMKVGCKPPALAELREKCSEVIAKFMLPTGMALFDQPLPRGATGKTVKKEIKEMLKQGRLATWTVVANDRNRQAKL